ncbi:PPR: pentatricopeptide repeat domain containing protein [Nitzschia inconspicua]|uniref:PPR: pentatricopeptide repeat domain containing protein n=1 Tax=Nitzschia inconspicua TaxID=303405 RepID=A0A9K3LFW7_9STRA|nr:PPR: pentatricopeptide repeat domain containing protein [Nitzschia inconspicua]
MSLSSSSSSSLLRKLTTAMGGRHKSIQTSRVQLSTARILRSGIVCTADHANISLLHHYSTGSHVSISTIVASSRCLQQRYHSSDSHLNVAASTQSHTDDRDPVLSDKPDEDDLLNFPPPMDVVIANIDKAAKYNQGMGGGPNGPLRDSKTVWNVSFVRDAVAGYEHYLHQLLYQRQQQQQQQQQLPEFDASSLDTSDAMIQLFLSPEITEKAFIAILRCKLPTHVLSRKIREWERYLGTIAQTEITDALSLAMLEANGKAGNVGRAIKLLELRKAKQYPPKDQNEFVYAVTAIEAAGLSLRRNRNTFLSEQDQPQIDDPTRWLDAILLNMHQRDVLLTTKLANRMLNTYATTGKSGKAVHYFYQISRQPIPEDADPDEFPEGMAKLWNRPVKVKMKMKPPPPYHKVPSQVEGKLIRKAGTDIKQLKLEVESEPEWSPALTSAISFADSLKQGACGHDPIELDLYSYSILMNACINRGSLWRAMHIIDEVMPANGIEPDVVAYNILLIGLARVGDVPTMREYFRQMIANGLQPSKETIQAVVDGLLNLGDVVSAVSFCQDSFNQYSVLPPYTTHTKILEFSLARGLVYEAKRHVSFIQQLWKWQPNQYHTEEFCTVMRLTQKNPHLSKEALQKLFAYFGEHLDESDFF